MTYQRARQPIVQQHLLQLAAVWPTRLRCCCSQRHGQGGGSGDGAVGEGGGG